MEAIMERACGLDIHKDSIVATIKGKRKQKEIKTYGTTNKEISHLATWVKSQDVDAVVMESTGIYWKPIYSIFEEMGIPVYLVNAKNVKNVPGKKTDVKDSEWLCDLVRHGLISTCFVPTKDIRDLRNFTRYRSKLTQQITEEKNRIHKYLEDYGIKISSVLSDIFGASGIKILFALIDDNFDKSKVISELKYHLKDKSEKICDALHMGLDFSHKFLIKTCLLHVQELEKFISDIDIQIDNIIANYKSELELIETVPGIKKESAEIIISEIGPEMSHFSDANHLCSWAGLCPGNNESAGKKKVEK